MIEVSIVSDDVVFVNRMIEQLGSDYTLSAYSPALADREPLIASIAASNPHIAVAGPVPDAELLSSLVGELDETFPHISVIAICVPGQAQIDYFRAGAAEALRTDAMGDELREAFAQAHLRALRRGGRPANVGQSAGRTLAILCPKGGVGKTTISTNLAVTLATADPGNVTLVDLDLQFGDVGPVLNLQAENSIADVGTDGIVDVRALKVSLSQHSSGLLVLTAPEEFTSVDEVGPQQVKAIMNQLVNQFSTVVVDTPAGIDDVTLSAVENATDLLFVTTTDVTSIRSVRRQLEAFDALGFTTQTRHAVVNRANSKLGMSLAEIERTLGLEIISTIPSSTALASAANQGVSLRDFNPRDRALRSLNDLADRFSSTADQPASRRWRK